MQEVLLDPTKLLTAALSGQTISNVVVINIATVPSLLQQQSIPSSGMQPPPVDILKNFQGAGGGIENIPFLQTNGDAATMFATFWIEEISRPSQFLQLNGNNRRSSPTRSFLNCQRKFFLRAPKRRMPDPSKIRALDLKRKFRRSAICWVSEAIDIDRSISAARGENAPSNRPQRKDRQQSAPGQGSGVAVELVPEIAWLPASLQ